MIRSVLLAAVGLSNERFSNWRRRGQLPFVLDVEEEDMLIGSAGRSWSHYTFEDAVALRVMVDLMDHERGDVDALRNRPVVPAEWAQHVSREFVAEVRNRASAGKNAGEDPASDFARFLSSGPDIWGVWQGGRLKGVDGARAHGQFHVGTFAECALLVAAEQERWRHDEAAVSARLIWVNLSAAARGVADALERLG